MKNKPSMLLLALILSASISSKASGQHHHGDGHELWPDSLATMTVTGTAIVDSSFFHPVYFLDRDGDSSADYRLAFGPWWYQPQSGATRPVAGEEVTIEGALVEHNTLPNLVVFEINGLVWREAVLYGMHGWSGDHFWDQQGDTLTASGVAMVDTSYFYAHYFLDTNQDSIPEYRLGFGPPWFEPESGVSLPADGDEIIIFGRLHEMAGIDVLSVHEINGLEWRALDEPAPWAGGWMHRDHGDTTFAYCVNDSSHWIGFAPGHMGGGMHGMFPDSSFVQFWQIHPDSVPGSHADNQFMAFYLNVHDPFGDSMMDGRFGGRHGGMRFQREQAFRFHYYDDDLERLNLDETSLSMQHWDAESNQWLAVSGVDVDMQTNTVTFAGADLSNYYTMAATTITSVDGRENAVVPSAFTLRPNYPNPFNPETTIEFELPAQAHVRLTVYNLLGQRIASLLDETRPAGIHSVQWRGSDDTGRQVGSGIYLVRMEAGTQIQTRRMTLLK